MTFDTALFNKSQTCQLHPPLINIRPDCSTSVSAIFLT